MVNFLIIPTIFGFYVIPHLINMFQRSSNVIDTPLFLPKDKVNGSQICVE
jgi:hypothetical protein